MPIPILQPDCWRITLASLANPPYESAMRRRAAFAALVIVSYPLCAAAVLERADEDDLTRELARFRKSQVRSVDYELRVELREGSDEFPGKAALDVALARTDAPLSIDFLWKQLEAVRVDGVPLADPVTRTGSFDIPAERLRDKVRIEVDYRGAFDKDGQGVQRVVDPQDRSEYVYTDFEAYYAHNLFPCFDQPDLKARYRLTVEAPAKWTVISNEIAEDAEPAANGRAVTRFPRLRALQHLSLLPGRRPVRRVEGRSTAPRRCACTRAAARRPGTSTRRGSSPRSGGACAFFESYFATPYPFSKFALVFVPEFAWGGMENPGAITLNERYLFRGPVPRSELDDRDNLILHEMAHMWFGDLVTMAWWNDLWLNESFASYLASVAQDRALHTRRRGSTSSSMKGWGYWQDQLVTTHPIETEVADVRTAKANFDGITYAKGAAALKQLHHFVGEDGLPRRPARATSRSSRSRTRRARTSSTQIASASGRTSRPGRRRGCRRRGRTACAPNWSCAAGRDRGVPRCSRRRARRARSRRTARAWASTAPRRSAARAREPQDVSYARARDRGPGAGGRAVPRLRAREPRRSGLRAVRARPASRCESARLVLTGGSPTRSRASMVWHALAQMVRDTELPRAGVLRARARGPRARGRPRPARAS